MARPFIVVLLLATFLTSCVADPPKNTRLSFNSKLEGATGAVVMVDACVNYDAIGNNDYFVVNEVRDGANALMEASSAYMTKAGLNVGTKIVPFVCGALHDLDNLPKPVAMSVGKEISILRQPFGVVAEIENDREYLAALQKLATYTFQTALAQTKKGGTQPPFFSADEAKNAASIIAARTNRASLVYIGVTGNSLSTGKASGIGLANMAASIALSVAPGPIATIGGSKISVIFLPSWPADSRQMVAGVVDLRSGTVGQTSVVHATGDPLKPETLAGEQALQLLMRDLVFTNVIR